MLAQSQMTTTPCHPRCCAEYVNYEVPTDVAAFKSQFRVPDMCQGKQIPKCDGQVSEKSLRFLRAGSFALGLTDRNTFSTAALRASAERKASSNEKPDVVEQAAPRAA